MTPKEKAKDKRLQKKYGWTLERYNKLEEFQHGLCAICGRPLNGRGNVDHFHFKITVGRLGELENRDYPNCKWRASTWIDDRFFQASATTKKEAIQDCKNLVLPHSVRGLLCPGRHGRAGQGCCNRLLGRVDNPEWLEKARAYLLDPPARKI